MVVNLRLQINIQHVQCIGKHVTAFVFCTWSDLYFSDSRVKPCLLPCTVGSALNIVVLCAMTTKLLSLQAVTFSFQIFSIQATNNHTSCPLSHAHLWFTVSGEQRGGQVPIQDPHVILFQSTPAGKKNILVVKQKHANTQPKHNSVNNCDGGKHVAMSHWSSFSTSKDF